MLCFQTDCQPLLRLNLPKRKCSRAIFLLKWCYFSDFSFYLTCNTYKLADKLSQFLTCDMSGQWESTTIAKRIYPINLYRVSSYLTIPYLIYVCWPVPLSRVFADVPATSEGPKKAVYWPVPTIWVWQMSSQALNLTYSHVLTTI